MELEDECKLMYEREKLLHARETTRRPDDISTILIGKCHVQKIQAYLLPNTNTLVLTRMPEGHQAQGKASTFAIWISCSPRPRSSEQRLWGAYLLQGGEHLLLRK